jgi:DNA-binding MarR family transcriptional regulator
MDAARESWALIHELFMANRGRLRDAAAEFDIHPRQAHLLRLLADGPRPMRTIACRLHCDPSNVTGISDRLEERGLVERQADPDDRRVKMLALTKKGERVAAALSERLLAPPPELAALAPADQEALLDLLRRAASGGQLAGVAANVTASETGRNFGK